MIEIVLRILGFNVDWWGHMNHDVVIRLARCWIRRALPIDANAETSILVLRWLVTTQIGVISIIVTDTTHAVFSCFLPGSLPGFNLLILQALIIVNGKGPLEEAASYNILWNLQPKKLEFTQARFCLVTFLKCLLEVIPVIFFWDERTVFLGGEVVAVKASRGNQQQSLASLLIVSRSS